MASPPLLTRWTVPVGFKTGMAVGVVLVSAIRGCAFDVAQMARSVDDAPAVAAQVAGTSAAPAVDEAPPAPAIPTANVEALPRVAVPVEDLPRSPTR